MHAAALSRLKGAEWDHRQDSEKLASPHGKMAAAVEKTLHAALTCLRGSGKQQKAWLPRVLSHAQCQHGHGPAVPPAPGGPTPSPPVRLPWCLAGSRLCLANKKCSPRKHRKLHPPNIMLLHKPRGSHVKARAAREQASCFGLSQAHVVSGQKSKAHMERKGKSIHRFRLFTVRSGAARCPQRAEGGMAAHRGSPSTATQTPCDRRDGEVAKKVDTQCICPHLPGKLSTVFCHGLCIGEGLCFWESRELEAQS